MTESDRIELRGVEFLAFCGVLTEEQERRQPFSFDIDIHLDLSEAAANDDLDATVDYGAVLGEIAVALEAERFLLLERMASRVADIVLTHPAADAVTVAAHKLRPPVPVIAASTGVRLQRHR